MTRPTDIPSWATSGDIETPDPSKVLDGWVQDERPAYQYFNYLQNLNGLWVANFVDELDTNVYPDISALEAAGLLQQRQNETFGVNSLREIFNTGAGNPIHDVCAGHNSLGAMSAIVAVGENDGIYCKPNGTSNWQHVTPDNTYSSGFVACVSGSAGFAIVGNGGEIQTSTTGTTFTERHLSGNNFNDVAVKETGTVTYLACGQAGYLWTRQTNLSGAWTSQTGAGGMSTDDYAAVEFANGLFVVTTGNTGKIMTSATGLTGSWTLRNTLTGTSPGYLNRQLKYSTALGWVAIYTRNSGEIGLSTSTDGITWTNTASSSSSGIGIETSLAFCLLDQQLVYLDRPTSGTSLHCYLVTNTSTFPAAVGNCRVLPQVAPIKAYAGQNIQSTLFVAGEDASGNGCVYMGSPFTQFA